MDKKTLTGFLAGVILVLAVWLVFFNGSASDEPKIIQPSQVYAVDPKERKEVEANTGVMTGDVQNGNANARESGNTGWIAEQNPNPGTESAIEEVSEKSGSEPPYAREEGQAEGPAKGLAGVPENQEKAVFRQGFLSRQKAFKFARYVSSVLKIPCEAEKTGKGYQVFFLYAGLDDKHKKLALLEKAGFSN